MKLQFLILKLVFGIKILKMSHDHLKECKSKAILRQTLKPKSLTQAEIRFFAQKTFALESYLLTLHD